MTERAPAAMAEEHGARNARAPRADAQRNRAKLLEAAREVFGASPDPSLDAVARRAGVGIGTLYRHFPTREALFDAVYRHEVDHLAALAEAWAAAPSRPIEVLRRWLHANIDFVATKKGMASALTLVAHKPTDLQAYSLEHLTRALDLLLRRAISAGEVRDDIAAADLLRALVGLAYMYDRPDWQEPARRLVDVLVDGLRREVAAPAGRG